MSRHSPPRLWSAIVAACASACIFVATLVEPHWIERFFDAAPDDGDGSLEGWIALAASLVATVVFAAIAGRERRLRGAAA